MMKRLYTFQAKIDDKDIEIFISKPSQSDIEDGEYIYARKLNLLIQEGFLTKAMMNKKFGDIGGIFSEKSNKDLKEALVELVEAKRRIEFYGNAKNLTEDQEEELKEANETYILLHKKIVENDLALQSMFNQSADAKAEEYMLKWFVLYNTYIVSEVDEGDIKKKCEFLIFDKPTFEEKEKQLKLLFEEIDPSDSESIKTKKKIIADYFTLIGRVVSIWYNGLGKDQDSVQEALYEYFPDDYKKEKKVVKQTKPKKS